MSSLETGNPVGAVCRFSWRLVSFALIVGLWLFAACDDPPKAPEPTVDIDEKQKTLRQKVDKTQSEAKARVDQAAEQIPDGDTGVSDVAAGPEQAPPSD